MILAVALCIICFVVGRVTVSHQEKLDNQAVLQERQQINEQIDIATKLLEDKKKQVEVAQDTAKMIYADAEEHQTKVMRLIEEQAKAEKAKHFEEFKAQRLEQERDSANFKQYVRQDADRLFQQKQIEYDKIKNELDKIKATRDAAIEAARKEREIQDSPQDYMIQLTDDEIHDIKYIESIKDKLFFSDALGKFIWSTYFQKKVKNMCGKVLGTEDVCGIYKLTDQATGECYIGQAKKVATRFQNHIKSGVGATPVSAANALYAAMRRDGVENFTFELLEACPAEQLDEKERFYIDLYSADTLGLNSKRGNQ